jgi:hypothetical protein
MYVPTQLQLSIYGVVRNKKQKLQFDRKMESIYPSFFPHPL